MHWIERQDAKAKLGMALRELGWKLYGWKDDESDPMTDYFSPASWEGVAEKNGYVVVVDISKDDPARLYSIRGRQRTRPAGEKVCSHCNGTGKSDVLPEGVINLFSDVKTPYDGICFNCHGRGKLYTGWETYYENNWPKFSPNPDHRIWHVEKDGKIVASGVGLSQCRKREGARELAKKIDSAIKAREAKEVFRSGNEVEIKEEGSWVWVTFSRKPKEEVLQRLKELGGRWSKRRMAWYFTSINVDLTWLKEGDAFGVGA